MTFDAHLAYNIPEDLVPGTQVYVTVTNFTNEHPPFYNNAGQASNTGTDDLVTNLIGRLAVAGVRVKL